MINPHWDRWIYTSAEISFNSFRGAYGFYSEFQASRISGDYFEFRAQGPLWKAISKRTFIADITINILVKATEDAKDFRKIHRMVGVAESAFIPCIPIKKYGNLPNIDNNSITIGQLILVPVAGRDFETTHFGKVSSDLPLIQSTVQGTYRAELTLD